MEFLVHQSAAGRHPLHVAGADRAAVAGAVAMIDFAVIDDRHGLETPVGMLSDTARLLGRRKVRRPRVVE
jgi:hypothetical protein